MIEAHKTGYSIWSLLVIMTLLAVWLAVPRRSDHRDALSFTSFFLCHQVTIWTLIATLIWLGTGKRRVVAIGLALIIVVVWLPLFAIVLEMAATHDLRVTVSVWRDFGMHRIYGAFYKFIELRLGY